MLSLLIMAPPIFTISLLLPYFLSLSLLCLQGSQVEGGNVPTTFWTDVDNSGRFKRKNVTFGSEPMVDALLFEPIPYRSAIKDGCTHVLVLRTLPDGHSVTGPLPLLQSMIINRFGCVICRAWFVLVHCISNALVC